MKNEWKVCRVGMIDQAVVAAVVWFSTCTLLSSLSLYSWIDLIVNHSPSHFPPNIPSSSIFQPLRHLDGSSLAWTLPRMHDTLPAGSDLLLSVYHEVDSKDFETEIIFFHESVLGISRDHPTNPTREEDVLLAFKHGVEEDPLGVLDSWFIVGGEEGCFCSWIGITCDLQRQHVVAVNLGGMQLRGAITMELQFLPFLTVLNLSSNYFYGRIPAELSHCRALRYLDLGRNQLSGPIPPELGKLNLLEGLWLHDNDLSGPIPHTLSNCQSLMILYLSNNKLRGSIPTQLGRLRRLKIMQLRGNVLTGSFPAALALCSALMLIDSSDNELTGIIPPELGDLEHLQALDLSRNQLSGEISASFANCTKLIFLNLYDNQLTGVLPTAIFSLRSLVYLSLGNNLLRGTICGDLSEGVVSNLRYLDVSHNQLTGTIPATFATLFRSMCYLNLSRNSISGSIPSEFGRLRLLVVDLSRNSIDGSIPSGLGGIVSLRHLNFSSNRISGEIPKSLTLLPELQVLDLSNNCLIGSIPRAAPFSRIASIALQGRGRENSCARNQGNACNPPLRKLGAPTGNIGSLILVPVTGVLGLVAIGVSIWLCAHRKYYGLKGGQEVIICPEIKCFPSRGFTLTCEEVRQAIESCYDENLIGKGRLSWVYKVVLADGRECAVRKYLVNHQAQRRLIQDLQILGRLRHQNLVKLLAYFSDGHTNALIYEYMPGASLELHLLRSQEICWESRFAIAVDVARALVYLHHESAFSIVHGHLKPSNIFVNFKGSGARVGDVGVGKYAAVSSSLEEKISDVFECKCRQEAYTAPEILQSTLEENLQPCADVYSFGVILLELTTGRGPDNYFGDCLVQAKPVERFCEVLDPGILVSSNIVQITRCISVALLCTNHRPQERPTMKEVLQILTQGPQEGS